MAPSPLKICLASSEFAPLAKTGGLADVSAALSAYLHQAGHDIRVLMPRYATLNLDGLAARPVDFLQNISVPIGPWDIEYSIDYVTLPDSGLTIYLLRCPVLYDRPGLYTNDDDEHLRFVLLSRAAIEMCQRMGFAPDVFHCHDWHTSLVPLYLRSIYAWDSLFTKTKSVLTIHNIGYQGVFDRSVLNDLHLGEHAHMLHQDDLNAGRINFLKTGLLHADALTTVSPTYAREIQGEEYGMGLDGVLRARSDRLVGILNGVDYGEWDPAVDKRIPANYTSDDLSGKRLCKTELMRQMGLDVDPDRPLVGIVTRLASQKGIVLMQGVLPALLARRPFSVVVLGSGEPQYERFFEALQQAAPGAVCFYRGYNEDLAHTIEAGSDIFLMPSAYEPCGLNQMYSLKYGTVPVVRRTGGLADSVVQIDPSAGTGTGVVFDHYDESGLAWALNRTLDLYERTELWRRLMRNGMQQDFSWQRQGERYVSLFRLLK
ncbi:MAG: glycogen synthase GlgA [Pseudomonadota bacterium]